MKNTVVSDVIHSDLQRGKSAVLVISSLTVDWAVQEEIKMDIKSSLSLDARPLISYSKTAGTIEVDGTKIRVPISKAQSASLKGGVYYYDIKAIIGDEVLIIIPGRLSITETTTRIP